MTRVKRGVTAHRRHKRLLKKVKGYQHPRTASVKRAREAIMKAGVYAYRDRKNKKRTFRNLWTIRLNATVRKLGLNYSRFIDGLTKADIQIDRKMLADLAVKNEVAFGKIVEKAKELADIKIEKKA